MQWYQIIIEIVFPLIAIIGGSAGIIYWRENKQLKSAEASKSTTEAMSAKADLAEQILHKFEQSVLARMDSGDAVRKKEFDELGQRIDSRLETIETDNRRQSSLLEDIVEFLNGDFQQFEANKHNKPRKKKDK